MGSDGHLGRRLVGLAVVIVVGAAGLGGLGLAFGSTLPLGDRVLTTEVLDGDAAGPGDRELVFSEDFDEALDPDLWGRCHWWADTNCTIASNDELEAYLPGNVTSGDDVLRLEARKEEVVDSEGRTLPYSSGMISSGPPGYEEDARFAFTYGYVEARLRFPRGQGLWPAFWLLPADHESRPEIDVIEVLGHEPDRAQLHYHAVAPDGAPLDVGHDPVIGDLGDGSWHDYAVDWQPGRITWIVDGQARWEVRGDRVADEPLYLVLNLAVGGDWPGDPDDTTELPAAVEAEWIRVWQ
jgi:beta-glucanase (GH16 family)